VTAVTNLRARSYSIAPETPMKVKKIAGRIVPAMITTTAVVTGLATMAVCRVLACGGAVSSTLTQRQWRGIVHGTDNTGVWLAQPQQIAQSFMPTAAKESPVFEEWNEKRERWVAIRSSPYFASWDRIEITGSITTTIAELLQAIEENFHGVRPQQLVDALSNTWVFNAVTDAPNIREFSVAMWTQRFLNLSDEALQQRGSLTFLTTCMLPVAVLEAAGESAKVRVNPAMPEVLFKFR
jgi:hypothetical protein